jgi:hypothetical protein
MPAVSRRQRRFFGMVRAGLIPKPPGMTDAQVREFARTPESRLPREPRVTARSFRRRRMQ